MEKIEKLKTYKYLGKSGLGNEEYLVEVYREFDIIGRIIFEKEIYVYAKIKDPGTLDEMIIDQMEDQLGDDTFHHFEFDRLVSTIKQQVDEFYRRKQEVVNEIAGQKSVRGPGYR